MNIFKSNLIFGPGSFSGNSAKAPAGANRLRIPVDNFFIQQNDVSTTTAAIVVVGDNLAGRQVEVLNPASFSIDDVVVMTHPPDQIYFGLVLAVVGPLLTCDSLIPFAFPVGSEIQSFTRDLNVVGSVTPQRFSIFGSGAPNVQLNLTRVVMTALTAAAVDLSKFGDIIGGLTNGIMLQGIPAGGLPPSNQWNVKTNADLDNLTGGDWKDHSAINPAQGQDGFNARYTYGNPDKHDVIPPINTGDRIDLIIQDNLTTILSLLMLWAGNQEITS